MTNQAGPSYTLGGFPIVSVAQVSNTVFNVTLKDPVTGEYRVFTLRAGATGVDLGLLYSLANISLPATLQAPLASSETRNESFNGMRARNL